MLTLIICLLFSSRPFAVFGRVSGVIVDAFDGVFERWFSSHVGKKFIVGRPSFTYFDASSTVIFIGVMARIIASLMYVDPRFPLRRLVRFAMLKLSLAGSFALKASARARVAVKQIIFKNNSFYAAIATTLPIVSIFVSMFTFAVECNNNQPTKLLVCNIDNWCRHWQLLMLRHCRGV